MRYTEETVQGIKYTLQFLLSYSCILFCLQRPIVAFSIENKAIMNIKQKRLEKSRARNPLCTDDNVVKHGNKRTESLRNDGESAQSRTENGNIVTEETEGFVGLTAKPGNKKLRTRFGLRAQAEIHKQSVHKDKHKKKLKRKLDQHIHNTKEKRKDPQVNIMKIQSFKST